MNSLLILKNRQTGAYKCFAGNADTIAKHCGMHRAIRFFKSSYVNVVGFSEAALPHVLAKLNEQNIKVKIVEVTGE